jgi:hypothetical protein
VSLGPVLRFDVHRQTELVDQRLARRLAPSLQPKR